MIIKWKHMGKASATCICHQTGLATAPIVYVLISVDVVRGPFLAEHELFVTIDMIVVIVSVGL